MDIFSIIGFLGGLALFLYGMAVLADSVESLAGGKFELILENITKNVFTAVLFGAVVTAAIQSSSATTVIVVGLINAKALKLRNAIGGDHGCEYRYYDYRTDSADVGNQRHGFFLQLLKPANLAPLAAVAGILIYLSAKRTGAKQVGTVGFFRFCRTVYRYVQYGGCGKAVTGTAAVWEIFRTLSNPVWGCWPVRQLRPSFKAPQPPSVSSRRYLSPATSPVPLLFPLSWAKISVPVLPRFWPASAPPEMRSGRQWYT